MVVDLFEDALKAVDLVKEVRVVMVKVAIRAKRFIMANLLLLLGTPKILAMALKGVRRKVKNPFIRDQENLEILAKASDF